MRKGKALRKNGGGVERENGWSGEENRRTVMYFLPMERN